MASGPTDGLIRYVCVDAAHGRRSALDLIGPTIHDACWAFCPGGAASGHRWAPLPGIALGSLQRLLERRDPSELVLDGPREEPVRATS